MMKSKPYAVRPECYSLSPLQPLFSSAHAVRTSTRSAAVFLVVFAKEPDARSPSPSCFDVHSMVASDDLQGLLKRDSAFLPEVWAWFGIGVTVIILRFVVRIRMVGFRGFAGDDYVTIIVSHLLNIAMSSLTDPDARHVYLRCRVCGYMLWVHTTSLRICVLTWRFR